MAASIPTSTSSDGDRSVIAHRLFTVSEYQKLAEAGVLHDEDRVELLEGVISPKMIHSPIHDATVSWIEQQLRMLLRPGWFIRTQSSLTLNERSEPEPDLAVVRGTPLDYVQRHPCGLDVAMVIEVAESSIGRDRFKAAGYAAAGIPVYLIINLQQRHIECYQRTNGTEYQQVAQLQGDETIALEFAFMDAVTLKASDFLP